MEQRHRVGPPRWPVRDWFNGGSEAQGRTEGQVRDRLARTRPRIRRRLITRGGSVDVPTHGGIAGRRWLQGSRPRDARRAAWLAVVADPRWRNEGKYATRPRPPCCRLRGAFIESRT